MLKKLSLSLAPASVTENSAAFLWDRPAYADEVLAYLLRLNGTETALCHCTDCTLDNLQPDTQYTVTVSAILKDNSETECSAPVLFRTRKSSPVLNILDYGAVGDGTVMNTRAIQEAVDACPDYGKVLIPKGIFLTGPIFLKGHMTLHLDRGSVLLGSGHVEDYPIFTYRYEGREQLWLETRTGRL